MAGTDVLVNNNFDGVANDTGPGFAGSAWGNYSSVDPDTGILLSAGGGNYSTALFTTSGVDASAAGSFTITWTVASASASLTSAACTEAGWFFGVQSALDGGGRWDDSPGFSFGVLIGSAHYSDWVVVEHSDTSVETQHAMAGTIPSDASLQDGFTLSIKLNSDDTWEVTTTGLSNTETTGSLSTNVTYSDLATNLLASTHLQAQGIDPTYTVDSVVLSEYFPILFGALSYSNVTTNSANLYVVAETNLTLSSSAVVWDTLDNGWTNVTDWSWSNSVSGSAPGTITGIATGLTADTKYFFRFYGENPSTNDWSTLGSFSTPLSDLQAPSFTMASGSYDRISLQWDDNANTETGYVLLRSTNETSFSQLVSFPADTTNYTDFAVAFGQTYYYRLAATNSVNGSGTDPSSCETNAFTTPAANMIFYESFETPVINGSRVPGITPGWAISGPDAANRIGLSDDNITGKTADQFAYIYDGSAPSISMQTTSTNLSSNLTAWVHYTLTCDIAVERSSNVETLLELLAGTTVIGSATSYLPTANSFSANGPEPNQKSSISIEIIPTDTHPNLDEMLSIRYSKTAGEWNKEAMIDNIMLLTEDTSSDFTPPSPTTMTWAGLPTPAASNSIFMCATNATDASNVQYLFTNTVNTHTSGWIDENYWTDTNLTPGYEYTYRVIARDLSPNMNTTAWSSAESVTCEGNIILYESFERPKNELTEWSGNWTRIFENDGVITTPYGLYALNTGYNAPALATLSDVLTIDYTYTLSFAACNHVPRTDVQYTVELRSDGAVVTNLIGTTSVDDMSVTNGFVFVPDSTTTNLGGVISLRFYHSDAGHDQWRSSAIFDDIKLSAVAPPPAGTVLIVK